jgi:hypothetical protein
MGRSGLKSVCFVAGLVLVLGGAFGLYVELAGPGMSEDVHSQIARGFMLLFPGYAFLAYSLHPSVQMSSRGAAPQTTVAEPAVIEEPAVEPVGENVITFPKRPMSRGPRTPGARTYT